MEEDDDFKYLASPLCECNLEELIENSYPLGNKPSKKQMCYQLVLGVLQLHKMNIIHRDLKPRNVLLGKQPVPTWKFTTEHNERFAWVRFVSGNVKCRFSCCCYKYPVPTNSPMSWASQNWVNVRTTYKLCKFDLFSYWVDFYPGNVEFQLPDWWWVNLSSINTKPISSHAKHIPQNNNL